MVVRRNGTGLLGTCKQVNVEAIDILYGVNTFAFTETMHPIRVNASLKLPEHGKLVRRLAVYDGMNDLLQMKDFFNLIGVLNLAKIRHIKIEIDVHSVFLGYVPTPSLYTGYSALGPGGVLGPGGNVICDAINMLAGLVDHSPPLRFLGPVSYYNIRIDSSLHSSNLSVLTRTTIPDSIQVIGCLRQVEVMASMRL